MQPTVSIDTENGPVRINHSALTDQHKLTDPQPDWSALFNATPKAPAAPAPAAVAPPPAPPPPAGQQPNQPLEPVQANAGTSNVPPAPASTENPPAPPAPPETFVSKINDRWFIVDGDNKPVAGKNGDGDKGFDTKKAAEEAKK